MGNINVLFMQSQAYFGADSMIHGLLMRHFNRSRVTVHVACNRGTDREPSPSLRALSDIPDLQVRPTHFGPSVNFRAKRDILAQTVVGGLPALASLGGLLPYAKKHKIDIIHSTEKPRDTLYGALLARAVGARFIVHLHVKVDHSWMSPFTKWAMRRADKLLGVSEFVQESAVNAGYSRQKTAYALNSIDATRWDPNTDGSAVRREFGISSEMPVMAAVSRLFPWKGHTELIKALAKVKEQRRDFRLLLVGEDDPRATPGLGSYTEELKSLTSQLGLNEQIIFTGFRRDIPALLAASDIYAMPSYEEPFGVAFLEAMAMEKPVIAVANGGTTQVVDHGKAGLLSEPYNIEELAANLLELLGDPARRRTMGAYARRRVEEYFTPVRMANDVERIYRSMLGLPEPNGG